MPGDAIQLEMDFHGPVGDGYANWLWDQQEALKRIAAVWGLPLGCRVRLRLYNMDSEFVGKLSLAEIPLSLDRRLALTLRLPPLEFLSTDIECCMVVEEQEGSERKYGQEHPDSPIQGQNHQKNVAPE